MFLQESVRSSGLCAYYHFSPNIDHLLDLCWTSAGPLLDLCWTSAGPLLDLCWTSSEHLLIIFQSQLVVNS